MPEIRQFVHADYTVGWICALPESEFVAAGAMLDKEHPVLPAADPKDTSSYLLGEIGNHNVVIVCLHTETGKVSAATVAKNMLRSFPAIRFGLMVGIGGGAPYYGERGSNSAEVNIQEDEDSEEEVEHIKDIRLGDVVVSLHSKSCEAVVQYDGGRSLQSHDFIHTGGKLNKPPPIVLGGVATLRQQHKRKNGNKISELLAKALSNNPGMAEEFQRPPSAKDRLFKSDVVHIAGRKSCKSCYGPNNANLVRRTEREPKPWVHYGTIGSADQVMKDALLRDQWARKESIMCFEMEAAGLMDSFPCLVIRGICDYADSHKNKIWQPYAAATAAAYAKELLLVIPGQGVMNPPSTNQLLPLMSSTESKVDMIRSNQDKRDEKKILAWITKVDFTTQQCDYFRRRQAGTGEWLLSSVEFQEWLKSSHNTMFCTGMPGAGKTIMTSIVINDLTQRAAEDESIGVAYVYCDFKRRDEQNINNLLLSLLKQLSETQSSLPKEVKDLFDRHRSRRTWPIREEISSTLISVAIKYSKLFIIIDALDECLGSTDCLAQFLSEIFNLQAKCAANIFATSRENGQIEKSFSTRPFPIRATDHDILRYLEQRMQIHQSEILDDSLRNEIKEKVVEATGGMFLLAELHLNSLLSQPTTGHLKEALQSLPRGVEGLNEMYNRTMERVENHRQHSRVLAKQALAWLLYARRPLSTVEIASALAVQRNTAKIDESYLPSIDILSSLCAGLITVDQESKIVRLVHHTAQEYLQQTQTHWFPNGQTDISSTCITYLAFDSFKTGFCPTDENFEERLRSNPLYDYAASNWGHHALEASMSAEHRRFSIPDICSRWSRSTESTTTQAASADTVSYLTLKKMMLEFLNSGPSLSSSCQAMLLDQGCRALPNYSQRVPRKMGGVHIAAYFGLADLLVSLIEIGHSWDLEDSYERTPLLWAALRGHEEVVRTLLERGARVDAADSLGHTPLSCAAHVGHESVVRLLLGAGAIVDLADVFCHTPLSLATEMGYEGVVKALLKAGANSSSLNSFGFTLLSRAAVCGYEGVVEAFLQAGARVDSVDKFGNTPLSLAVCRGHEGAVKALLTAGASVDRVDEFGDTPLSIAAEMGYNGMVKALLAKGARVDSADDSRHSPLLSAAMRGHERVVEALLYAGAKVDPVDKFGFTPLSSAAKMGYDGVVKTLLARGARVDSMNEFGHTPLSWAAQRGNERVVKILLKAGARVNTVDKSGQTPLSWAVLGGGRDNSEDSS